MIFVWPTDDIISKWPWAEKKFPTLASNEEIIDGEGETGAAGQNQTRDEHLCL